MALFVHKPGRKLLVASADGRGFVVPEDEVVAQTRAGKQVLNLADGVEAAACAPVEGDTVAVIGDNRKLLVFPLDELPEMTRGRGVILQRYKDGGLADVKVLHAQAEGLTWRQGDRTAHRDRPRRLARRARPGRPPAAPGLPAKQQVRLRRRDRPVTMGQHLTSRFDDSFKYRGAHAAEPGE